MIFRFFYFRILGFLDWGIFGSLDLWISGHQELNFRVPEVPRLENTTIYICTIHIYTYVHEHTPRAKPDFCSGGRILCKPNYGALLSTSIDDSKSPNHCALLGTRTSCNNDSKSIGGGMEILELLLAVITITFIVQLILHVTMIATMVLIIIT